MSGTMTHAMPFVLCFFKLPQTSLCSTEHEIKLLRKSSLWLMIFHTSYQHQNRTATPFHFDVDVIHTLKYPQLSHGNA